MESTRSVIALMASMNIKNIYLQVPICPAHQHFLQFFCGHLIEPMLCTPRCWSIVGYLNNLLLRTLTENPSVIAKTMSHGFVPPDLSCTTPKALCPPPTPWMLCLAAELISKPVFARRSPSMYSLSGTDLPLLYCYVNQVINFQSRLP